MADQQRARVIFGRCVLAGGLLKVGTSYPYPYPYP